MEIFGFSNVIEPCGFVGGFLVLILFSGHGPELYFISRLFSDHRSAKMHCLSSLKWRV